MVLCVRQTGISCTSPFFLLFPQTFFCCFSISFGRWNQQFVVAFLTFFRTPKNSGNYYDVYVFHKDSKAPTLFLHRTRTNSARSRFRWTFCFSAAFFEWLLHFGVAVSSLKQLNDWGEIKWVNHLMDTSS